MNELILKFKNPITNKEIVLNHIVCDQTEADEFDTIFRFLTQGEMTIIPATIQLNSNEYSQKASIILSTLCGKQSSKRLINKSIEQKELPKETIISNLETETCDDVLFGCHIRELFRVFRKLFNKG